MPVIANGVVRALSSVSDAFCGTTVALIVSPSTREMVSSSLRLRSKGISSVNMGFPPGLTDFIEMLGDLRGLLRVLACSDGREMRLAGLFSLARPACLGPCAT